LQVKGGIEELRATIMHRMHTEISETRGDTRGLYWFGPAESEPYVQFGGGIKRESSALEEGVVDVPLRGAPGLLILHGVPWVASRFTSIIVAYIESLSELNYHVLYTNYIYVLGTACQVGRVH
jgi:hypothetical protein